MLNRRTAGHFYLTKLLLPVLLSTAKSSPPGTVRIVNVSSSAAYMGQLDFNTFKDSPARRKRSTVFLYCQSKLVGLLIIPHPQEVTFHAHTGKRSVQCRIDKTVWWPGDCYHFFESW
jgi:hypothetical protein